MSFINFGKTTVSANFDTGFYKGSFNISNKYLDSFWFNHEEEIWNSILLQIAVIVEKEIEKRMKDKMNKEAYEKEFAFHAKVEGDKI